MNKNIIKEYEQFLIWKNLSNSTIKLYLFVARDYLIKFQYEINKNNFSKFIKEKKNNNIKPSTFKAYMLSIYQFFKFLKIEWLQEWKDNFKLPSLSEEPQLVLSKEEIEKLLLSLNLKRFYQFKQYIWVKFLFETGLRVSEFANLRKNDLVNNSFQIVGKGKKQRKVFISNELKEMISKWPYENFCVNKKGGMLSTKHIRFLIKNLGRKNGFEKLTPHTFRRSFCTHLIKNNCNMKAIQTIMGHSSLAITSRYIHLSEKEIYEEYLKAF